MNENTNNNVKSNTTTSRLFSIMTAIMCAAILIVTFIAFRTIENTATAFTILFSGIILDAIIYINGKHKQ